MPVVTRSQSKNIKPEIALPQLIFHRPLHPLPLSTTLLVVNKIKALSNDSVNTIGSENKMKIALELYQIINHDLFNIVRIKGFSRWWQRFTCSVFNKILEFEREYQNGKWAEINDQLVQTFIQELNLAKEFIVRTIKNYDGPVWDDCVLKTKDKIVALESERPRRNIKRVNYREDSDYEFEDEEE